MITVYLLHVTVLKFSKTQRRMQIILEINILSYLTAVFEMEYEKQRTFFSTVQKRDKKSTSASRRYKKTCEVVDMYVPKSLPETMKCGVKLRCHVLIVS